MGTTTSKNAWYRL
jgi:hypothetical protein